jgi:hypothetical protein
MKQKFTKVFSLVLILITVVTGCTNYEQVFIDEAKAILEGYQLDSEILMIYDKKLEDYNFYKMNITSEKFAEISDTQKREILLKLDAIFVSDSKIIAIPEITSQGHTFSLDYEDKLERDGDLYPPKSTSMPFVMPKGDFEMSWDIYDSEYNSLGGILTIRRQGSKYTQKLVMSDGSSSTDELTVISGGDEIRLTDRPGNPFGDYMYISSTGYLYFCDSEGVIYSVPPLE